MKQRFFKLLLGVAVFCLLAGSWVLAIQEPNECCKLRADFTLEIKGVNTEFKSGDYVGAEMPTPGTPPQCDLDGDGTQDFPAGGRQLKEWGMVCLMGTIYLVIKWLFIIIMLVVTIMIIYGGFLFVTAAGDPDRASRGKKVLMYAIIGLAVALLARVIPSVVRFIIGV